MMAMVHFHKKSPLKDEAEDAYALHPAAGIFAVLDGVTPVHAYKDEYGHNGAYIAANLFKKSFEKSVPDMRLVDIITSTNRRLRELMMQAGADLMVLHELWSTCIAAVQIRGNSVHYAQLGDSMIVAVNRDGRISTISENRLHGISQRAKLARELARKEGALMPDESHYDIPLHRNQGNRWMANHPDGYGVANGMVEIGIHLQSGVLPAEELRHLLLITDGLFHPELELEDACARIIELGFEKYVDEVEAAERRKQLPPDDRTGILMTF